MKTLESENSLQWKKGYKFWISIFTRQQDLIAYFSFIKFHKLVSYKWIFEIKYNVDGSMARYKVDLVAKGFSEVEGIDVNKTFSLVAQMEWIQIVLIVVAISRCIKWMSKLIF